jgi:ribosome-binding factor A
MSRHREREHSQRQLRVGEEIRHALAELVERGDMRDPELRGVPITVTVVDISPDLRNALAFIVPLGGRNAEQVLAAMRRAAPYFRARIAKMVDLRFAPELRFELDRSFDHAHRINTLLHDPEVARDLDGDAETQPESGAAGPAKRQE